MRALIVLSAAQGKQLIARGVADIVADKVNRVYVAYGSTNAMILEELGIDKKLYVNGYIADNALQTNNKKPELVVINADSEQEFIETMCSSDLIIKGANALMYENGSYKAAVSVASSNGGTYGRVVIQATCVGARVIIPVSLDKLVPKILNGKYQQNSFDMVMGVPITLFQYEYGEIFTEIDALQVLYKLEAELYTAGSLESDNKYFSFVVEGEKKNILKLQAFSGAKELDGFQRFPNG